jgi:hypothetical protein
MGLSIVFKIVEKGQFGHDMIFTWKIANKSGIEFEDQTKGTAGNRENAPSLE